MTGAGREIDTMSKVTWKVEHYIPHQPMILSRTEDGTLNSWFSRIVDENGETIADCLDHRRNRGPNDPGPSPIADRIVRACNAENEVENGTNL